MRLSFPLAVFAAASGLVSVIACSGGSDTGTVTSGDGGTSSSGGSSSGASTSSGGSSGASTSSGGTTSSSGASTSSSGSSSGSPGTCTAPAISGTKTLGTLSSTEKGQLCDYAACPFGGYGKSKSCGDGTTAKSKASQSACLGDATWTKCGSLAVSDFLACSEKINADPCEALTTVTSDPACASFKSCAFGQ